jgi:hypothetical protein
MSKHTKKRLSHEVTVESRFDSRVPWRELDGSQKAALIGMGFSEHLWEKNRQETLSEPILGDYDDLCVKGKWHPVVHRLPYKEREFSQVFFH